MEICLGEHKLLAAFRNYSFVFLLVINFYITNHSKYSSLRLPRSQKQKLPDLLRLKSGTGTISLLLYSIETGHRQGQIQERLGMGLHKGMSAERHGYLWATKSMGHHDGLKNFQWPLHSPYLTQRLACSRFSVNICRMTAGLANAAHRSSTTGHAEVRILKTKCEQLPAKPRVLQQHLFAALMF